MEIQWEKVPLDYVWVETPLEIKRGDVGAPFGAGACLLGAAPLSYKRRGGEPLSYAHLHLSLLPRRWHFPSLACWSNSRTLCLGEALSKYSLHHHHYVVVLLEVPEDPLLPLPTGARGGGRRRTVRVTDYGGAARSWHQDIKPPSSSRPWGRARTLYTIHVCLRERFSRYRSTRVSSRKTVAIYLLDSILFLLQP